MNAEQQAPESGCLKVSSKSYPASVAGAIAAISRGFLSPIGIEIACIPSFADIVIDGEYRTAIRFAVEPRYTHGTPIADSALGE